MVTTWLVSLLAVFSVLAQVPGSKANVANRRTRVCGEDQKNFLKWFCADPTFDFPFDFSRPHIILRYRAPSKDLYPFQHQAAGCCKRGCMDYEFQVMCRYHSNLEKCEAGKNLSTIKGTKARADCLTKTTTHKTSDDVESSTMKAVERSSLLYKFKRI